MAKGPHSSLRVTVPQGVMFGGPEEGVVEVGQDECQGVEIHVEEVEAGINKDDCMVGRVMMDFCTRATLELHPALEPQCGVHGVLSMSRHENTRVWRMYRVHSFVLVCIQLIEEKRHLSVFRFRN